jgi:hypothetical protein
MELEKNIQLFMNGFNEKDNGRGANERYASFDYCYNYFQSFIENNNVADISNKDNLEKSCLQLSFYLASWGMFRGSSFLLSKSIKFFEPLIVNISKCDGKLWDFDIDKYDDGNTIEEIMKCKNMIFKSFSPYHNVSDTLISKIMLGVFGNVPAFDNYFARGFNMYSFCKNNLRKIYDFYSVKEHKEIIDKYSKIIYTIDFKTGKKTKFNYTKAKIIDMVGFVEGYKRNNGYL